MMRLHIAFICILLPALALAALPAAADPGHPAAPGGVLRLLSARLDDRVVARLRDAPDRALAHAAEVILGHGSNGSIGPDGIERAIDVDRAATRARRMVALLSADLDNDGTITAAEVRALAATLDADSRGRLLVAHRAADRDGNGATDMAELRHHADARGGESWRAGRLRALMAFDLDGDTRVTLDEVAAGLRALDPTTAADEAGPEL